MASQELSRADLVAFLDRDWALARRVKDEAVAKRIRAHGTGSAFVLSQMLFEQVWPRLRGEPNDLSGLIRYRRKLTRAAAARR